MGLILAVAVTTGAAFGLTGDSSDSPEHDVGDDWKLVEASGWPGGFSLLLPQGWQLNELQGIDSYVGEIIGGGGRLNFDFGWYSSSLVDGDDPKYVVSYEEIGGRRAKLVRPRVEGDGLITGVYFEDIDGSNLDIPSQNRLQISGVGLTPAQQETALVVFRTIRPLASGSLGDTEPFDDQRPVTSMDDIDPDECNWIHNITACEGPVSNPDGYQGIADGELYPDEGDSIGVPTSSAMCIEEVPDCIDMLVIGHDEEGTIGPDFGEDVPYLVPDSDIECSSDQAVSITSDGQSSCVDLGNSSKIEDGKDVAGQSLPPVVEPAQ